jgi:hypothetical protein
MVKVHGWKRKEEVERAKCAAKAGFGGIALQPTGKPRGTHPPRLKAPSRTMAVSNFKALAPKTSARLSGEIWVWGSDMTSPLTSPPVQTPFLAPKANLAQKI